METACKKVHGRVLVPGNCLKWSPETGAERSLERDPQSGIREGRYSLSFYSQSESGAEVTIGQRRARMGSIQFLPVFTRKVGKGFSEMSCTNWTWLLPQGSLFILWLFLEPMKAGRLGSTSRAPALPHSATVNRKAILSVTEMKVE